MDTQDVAVDQVAAVTVVETHLVVHALLPHAKVILQQWRQHVVLLHAGAHRPVAIHAAVIHAAVKVRPKTAKMYYVISNSAYIMIYFVITVVIYIYICIPHDGYDKYMPAHLIINLFEYIYIFNGFRRMFYYVFVLIKSRVKNI